ncbi:MAG: restriction endonuclease subunit S [Candidatus Izemoplasmatales bacterium]|nr:restriction endonuclease subunit S [Candidatus Izemoplasmatales bacterium]
MVNYPENWKTMQLKDIADYRNGKAHEKNVVEHGKYTIVNAKFVSTEGKVKKYCDKQIEPLFKDEIAMVLSDIPNGRALAKTFLINKNNKYSLNQRIAGIKPHKNINAYFLAKLMNRNEYFLSFNDGINQTNLSVKNVKEFSAKYPCLKEQQAIAETLSTFDKYIENLIKLIEKKKAIRDGVLEELISGKTRVGEFKEEWQQKTLKELCYLITKQTGFDYSDKIKESLVTTKRENTVPFIQNKDFNMFDINYNTDFYIPKVIADNYPKIILKECCLLISISGRIGNVAVFNNEQMAFAGGAVGIAKLYDKSLADWCMLYLTSVEGQKQIFKNEKVGAQHNLTVEDVRKFRILIPNKEERDSIVAVIKSMDEEIISLEKKLDKMKQISEGAMNELLTGQVRLSV